MIVEDTKDLVETADYVIIEAVLVDDGCLLYTSDAADEL